MKLLKVMGILYYTSYSYFGNLMIIVINCEEEMLSF